MSKPELSQTKCEPCNGNTEKLDFKKINDYLSDLNKWSLNNNKEMIYKKFKFKDFNTALIFTNKVGELADKEGHHPDISIGWGYCLIMLHTHAIQGLSINDFILASKIDHLNEI